MPDEQYAEYLDGMSGMMASKLSRIAIVDGRASDMNSPKHARMQAIWLRKEWRALSALDFGTVLVIDRPVVRFSLSAMLTVAPIPGTYKVVSTFGDAVSWAIARLGAAGLSVPPRLLHLGAEASGTRREGDAA